MTVWKATLPRETPKAGTVSIVCGIKTARGSRSELANAAMSEDIALAAYRVLNGDEKTARLVLVMLDGLDGGVA